MTAQISTAHVEKDAQIYDADKKRDVYIQCHV